MRLQTSVKSENLHKKADGGCLMRVSTIQRDESNAQGNEALFAMGGVSASCLEFLSNKDHCN